MAVTKSSIEWTDSTWSPVTGCTKVSPGCDHCYAETIARRFAGQPTFPNGFDVTLRPDRLDVPLRWKKPRRIFVNSMSDLFHKDVPDEHIAKIFAVMAATPRHTYQVLTKRHARMRALLSSKAFHELLEREHLDLTVNQHPEIAQPRQTYPLANVWLGVSVENQQWADIRIPALLKTPAAIRFISAEPLLGPLDLTSHLLVPCPCCKGEPHDDGCGHCDDAACDNGFVRGLHWVIVGGESGHGARAMHPDWVREIRDACTQTHTPFLFKQWGEWGPAPFVIRVCDPKVGWTGTDEALADAKRAAEAQGATHVHTGSAYVEDGEQRFHLHEIGHKPWSLERVGLPDGMEPIRRWGKKRAGRALDGRTWNQFPRTETTHA
jgi:protein gp37